MNKKEVDEIIACLPRGETQYTYAKDQYATELLARVVKRGKAVSEIKQSSYRQLLNKKPVKTCLAKAGSGYVSAGNFRHAALECGQEFVLTLSRWGGVGNGYQTSRQGYNLVLQLNFSEEHNARYRQQVNPRYDALFNFPGHPVLRKGQREIFYETLAWSRIDLDFDTNTALIEEIQSDWIREAYQAYQARTRFRHKDSGRYWARQMQCTRVVFAQYVEEALEPYKALWTEAMLMASLRFIVDELGVGTVYYHSCQTGAAVKRIHSQPPRSLYSELPRRFCFEKTRFAPTFLVNSDFLKRMRTVKTPHWYRLSF
jgi:hypothetical protein